MFIATLVMHLKGAVENSLVVRWNWANKTLSWEIVRSCLFCRSASEELFVQLLEKLLWLIKSHRRQSTRQLQVPT